MTEYFNRANEKGNRQELRNSMPDAEVLLWSRLKGRQLLGCKFRRQFSVGPFVMDFYSPEIKLGIELDGDSHFREGKRTYDADRDAFIGSFGIKVARFLNTDIYENLDGVLETLGRVVLERRTSDATPPNPPFVRGGKEERLRRRNAKESGAEVAQRWVDESVGNSELKIPREDSAPPDSPPYEGGVRGGSYSCCESPAATPPNPPFLRGGADSRDIAQCAFVADPDNAPNVAELSRSSTVREGDNGLVPHGAAITERRGS